MKLIFIGTGSGVTSLKRFHSSLLFSEKDFKLLVDAGDGISKALLSQKISFKTINAIIISHLHPDHFSGLASLIVQMKISGRKEGLTIFAHRSLVKVIENLLLHYYIFIDRLGFKIKLEGFEHDEKTGLSNDFSFTSKQNTHLDHYKAFDKKGSLSFSCSSFLFEYKNQSIFYTGDVGSIDDLFIFSDKKIQILITETSHIDISDLYSLSHFNKTKKIIFTHISDEVETSLKDFLNSISDNKGKKHLAAYDGMTINI